MKSSEIARISERQVSMNFLLEKHRHQKKRSFSIVKTLGRPMPMTSVRSVQNDRSEMVKWFRKCRWQWTQQTPVFLFLFIVPFYFHFDDLIAWRWDKNKQRMNESRTVQLSESSAWHNMNHVRVQKAIRLPQRYDEIVFKNLIRLLFLSFWVWRNKFVHCKQKKGIKQKQKLFCRWNFGNSFKQMFRKQRVLVKQYNHEMIFRFSVHFFLSFSFVLLFTAN